MSFFGAAAQQAAPEQQDIEVGNLPTDSTSAIAFSPTQDFLAVASWSNEVRLGRFQRDRAYSDRKSTQVRIYEVNAQGQSSGKAAYSHEGPALCVTWSKVRNPSFPRRFPLLSQFGRAGRNQGHLGWSGQSGQNLRCDDWANESGRRSR